MAWCPYGRHEVNVWRKYRQQIDIRVGLFIVSTDYISIV